MAEILRVFVNILTPADNYRVRDSENLTLPNQMQLSEKRETLSQFFVPFQNSTSNFKHFERKNDRHSECISKMAVINTCELSMRPLFSCFLIIFRVLDWENMSPSVTSNLRGVC